MKAWSTVAVVPTEGGLLFFKESPRNLVFEAAYTSALAQIVPDAVPEVVAHDPPRGWLLMRNAGTEIAETGALRGADDWDDVLRLYASVQLAVAPRADALRALGVPDRAPERLGDAFDEFLSRPESFLVGERHAIDEAEYEQLRGVAGEIRERAGAIDDVVRVTAAHEEVHGWNVFVRDGRIRILDWAEGGIAHPFGSLIGTFRFFALTLGLEPGGSAIVRLRDVYLGAWRDFAPHADLVRLFSAACPLGALCRVLTWDRITAPLEPEARAEIIGGVTRWLRILLAVLQHDAPLGFVGEPVRGA